MPYSTDIRYLIANDSSLNATVNGGIYWENLPDNFDITKKWIVYSFNKTEQINCLRTDLYVKYALVIKILATDTIVLESLSDYVLNMLNDKNYNKIQDIVFINDNRNMDLEKGIYMNTLTFDTIYL